MTDARTLTHRHRAEQLLLRRDTIAKAERLWPALNWARLDATYPGFAASASRLVQINRETSAGLAAQYLRAFRRASGITGTPRIIVAGRVDAEQLATSLRVTSVVAIKNAAAAGTAADVAMANARTLATGAIARLVLNAGRETVTKTLTADPRARGYQRVLGGGGCDFCQMLAGRGAVYGEASADFEAHDKCGCTAEPVYT